MALILLCYGIESSAQTDLDRLYPELYVGRCEQVRLMYTHECWPFLIRQR